MRSQITQSFRRTTSIFDDTDLMQYETPKDSKETDSYLEKLLNQEINEINQYCQIKLLSLKNLQLQESFNYTSKTRIISKQPKQYIKQISQQKRNTQQNQKNQNIDIQIEEQFQIKPLISLKSLNNIQIERKSKKIFKENFKVAKKQIKSQQQILSQQQLNFTSLEQFNSPQRRFDIEDFNKKIFGKDQNNKVKEKQRPNDCSNENLFDTNNIQSNQQFGIENTSSNHQQNNQTDNTQSNQQFGIENIISNYQFNEKTDITKSNLQFSTVNTSSNHQYNEQTEITQFNRIFGIENSISNHQNTEKTNNNQIGQTNLIEQNICYLCKRKMKKSQSLQDLFQ